jgi:hypothetical protein
MSKFNIASVKPIKIKKSHLLKKVDYSSPFKDSKKVAKALAEAILDGDEESFHDIFCAYLATINKEELSRRTKVPIATIRRMAAGKNFNVKSMLKVTAALKAAS